MDEDSSECAIYSFVISLYKEETIVSWADGFMIVFDVTKETSFESIAQIKEDLEYKKSAKNISYVVVGNKADLEHSREVSPERARKLCLTIPAAYFECCACAANDNGKTESLREAFAELCREIKRRKSVSGNNKPERRLSLFRRLVPSSNPKKQTLSPPNQGLGMPYRRGGGSTLRRRKSVAGLIGMQDRSERSRSPIPPICLEEPDDQRTQTFGRPLRRYGVDGLYVKP